MEKRTSQTIKSSLRTKVILLYEKEKNMTKLADNLQISRSSVSRIIDQWKNENSVSPKQRGRKKGYRKLDENTIENIRNEVRQNPKTPFVDISKKFNVDPMQITRRCREVGIRKFRAAKKIKFTPEIIEERIRISDENQYLPQIVFDKTIWLDEFTFSSNKKGVVLVSRMRGQRYLPEFVEEVDAPRRPVTVSCLISFCKKGLGPIIPLEGYFTKVQFQNYLDLLAKFAYEKYPDEYNQVSIIMDNHKIHLGCINKLNLLFPAGRIDHPARSPDLNVIENLIGYIKNEFYRSTLSFTDAQQITDYLDVISERLNNDPNLLSNYADSQRNRYVKVANCGGNHTGY